jgi:hypothetical protein
LGHDFFPGIPRINDVVEVNLVENMKVAVFFVEIVKLLSFLLRHLVFVEIQKELDFVEFLWFGA